MTINDEKFVYCMCVLAIGLLVYSFFFVSIKVCLLAQENSLYELGDMSGNALGNNTAQYGLSFRGKR